MPNLIVLFPLLFVIAWATGKLWSDIRSPKLAEVRSGVKEQPVRLLCGDCAGDKLIPQITFLTENETCHRCGGRSFVRADQVRPSLKLPAADQGRKLRSRARRAALPRSPRRRRA